MQLPAYAGNRLHIHTLDDPAGFYIDKAGMEDGYLEFTDTAGKVGGGQWYVSADESLAVLSYYSGQSEEAWHIYRFKGCITPLWKSDFVRGETASVAFLTPSTIIIAVPFSCTGFHDITEDPDPIIEAKDMYSFYYASLWIFDTNTQRTSEHQLRILMSSDTHPQIDSYDPYFKPKLLGPHQLQMSFPWGEEIIAYPPEDIILVPYNHTSHSQA